MIGRKLIAVTPLLLILGIIAQAILLVFAVVLYVPMLIWPDMLTSPYLWVTRNVSKIMVRAVIGRKARDDSPNVIIPLRGTPG
jgi:hypothetical protein